MAYITDASHISDETLAQLQGLEVLVLNALRPQPHYSHFSLPEALEVAQRIGAKRTYFTHLSHLMGMHEQAVASLPEGIRLAHDGLTLVREADVWTEVPSPWTILAP